jgi:RNA polymerase sigma-70 factor (ECF subfamily)
MDTIPEIIIEKALHGDLKAFEFIYQATAHFVYNSSLRITGNEHDAQEVTQDVYMKIYKKIKQYRLGTSFKSWIYRIAFNESINFVKKRKKKYTTDYSEEIFEKCGVEAEVTTKNDKRQIQTRLDSFLAQLSVDYKACILLREIEGFSYNQIADTLKININTVRTRLKRARMQLIMLGKKAHEVMPNEM